MVVPRGNAPRSSAYKAEALLLSYGTKLAAQVGFAPTPFRLTSGRTTVIRPGSEMVGTAGFSLAISWSQAKRFED